ncbi:YqaA family protein [Edaphobacter sp. HDX4]|uniref:YqaA family protein n=1 Tax=Edaphobacter sp. HDX4 TaxID=2794064 RepID=UPI002FE61040
MKIAPASAWLHKLNALNAGLMAALTPFGAWGLGGLAIIDSAAIPVPLDAMVIEFVVHDHARFVLYCFMAALGSAIGSMLPFYLGRAGGELFLLKRINRERYEQLRDKFERQEFLAIMIPAMMPPPMPVKLFEIAAGVFEMRTLSFFGAILLGKFIRFMAEAIITILYGPKIVATMGTAMKDHLGYVLAFACALILLIGIWVMRKVFDRRKGDSLASERDVSDIPD